LLELICFKAKVIPLVDLGILLLLNAMLELMVIIQNTMGHIKNCRRAMGILTTILLLKLKRLKATLSFSVMSTSFSS